MMSYLQRLEIMAFFSGYPLVYLITLAFAGKPQTRTVTKKQLVLLLPFSYALTGVLYLGLQLKNLYPDYSVVHINSEIQNPFLIIWGLLTVLFWIPALNKKPVISLLHSLVFFFPLLKDLYIQISSESADKSVLKNDMKVYSDSILLNISTFVFIIILYFLITHFRKTKKSNHVL